MLQVSGKKILIAPLDWGLGHATRCIPVIRKLIERNVEVHLGGSGKSGKYLSTEFPHLTYHEIPGYEVTYSNKLPMAVAMLRQAPAILRSIQQERKWLEENISIQHWDAVIADHRYGLHHNSIHSVFMAHQLFISSGANDLLEPVLWKANKSYIEKFDTCWIPDMPGIINASGKLSHKQDIPFPHTFIGILSRLTASIKSEKKYKLCFILSGLEPLRTEFEHKIVLQLEQMPNENYVLIRGTNEPLKLDVPSFLEVINLADSNLVQELMSNTELVVSRSGYSSIMDYLTLGTKALLVPTPGQTEQEYLAKYHLEAGHFYSVKQEDLELSYDVKHALSYQPTQIGNEGLMDQAIDELLASIPVKH